MSSILINIINLITKAYYFYCNKNEMPICYVELYNRILHGDNGLYDISGHYISIWEPLSLNKFYSLENSDYIIYNNSRKLNLELVKNYTKDDTILCSLITSKLILFQRLWKKYYKNQKKLS